MQPAFYLQLFSGIHRILLPAERKYFRWLMVCNLFTSALDIFSIGLLFMAVRWYAAHSTQPALWPALLLLACFAAKSAGGYWFYKAQCRFAFAVSGRLSATLVNNYLEGGYENYARQDTAALVRSIVHAPAEFAQFILSGAQQLLTEILLIAIAVSALLWYNGWLLIVVCLTLAPAVLVLFYLTRKKLHGIRRHIKTVNENALQYLHEALHGYIESNMHNRNAFFTQRYAAKQHTVNSYVASLQIMQGLPSRFFEIFAVLGICLLMFTSRAFSAGYAGEVLTLGAFIAATYKIIPGISRVINLTTQINTYRYVLEELAARAAPAPQHTAAAPAARPPVTRIEGQQLSFSYPGHTAFQNLNFVLQQGQLTGISAPSGRGKTTLLHVLLGFLQPRAGSILINGQPASAAVQKALWQQTAYVQQQPLLLHASILDNIVLFQKPCNQERLQQVLQVTGLADMLQQLPQGIHQVITENGRNISGGQRQRIAIARALYKQAAVILLDEPFNELDETSENSLLEHFRQLAADGKIIVLITHNSNSLQRCHTTLCLPHV